MSEHGNVYEGLLEEHDDGRWAFGKGFDDPLAGVDTAVPQGVDGADLAAYCLMLGDDALILCQRLTEWVTHAPELEEEVALANVGLDLLGQTRLLYTRAAAADPDSVPAMPDDSPIPPEDALAYFRDASAFRSVWLVELDNGDFAVCMTRLLVFSTWRLALLHRLQASRDPVLAAVAAKGVKEVAYHRDYAARWVVTLAQGTAESRRRTLAAIEHVWPYLAELFQPHPVELRLPDVACGSPSLQAEVESILKQVLTAGSLPVPAPRGDRSPGGGRNGVHTETFPALLAELQSLARAHPRGVW